MGRFLTKLNWNFLGMIDRWSNVSSKGEEMESKGQVEFPIIYNKGGHNESNGSQSWIGNQFNKQHQILPSV